MTCSRVETPHLRTFGWRMLFIDARKLGTLVDRTRKEFADKDIDRIAGVSNVFL